VLLVLYLRLDESMKQHLAGKIALIIVLLSIPYTHPAPSVIIVFFLLALELSGFLYRRTSRSSPPGHISASLPLISIIAFFTWISSFVVFGHKVNALWTNLREPLAAPHVQTLENAVGGASTGSTVIIFLKMYGDSVICLLLAIMGAMIVIERIWRSEKGKGKGMENLLALTAICLVAVPVELLIFAGSRSQTVGRMINLSFAAFLSPILAAYALHQILRRARKSVAIATSSVVLLSFWAIGTFGLYHSPWISQPSWQITQMDIRGIEWFLQNKDNDVSFSGMGYAHGVPYATHGYHSAISREDLMQPVLQMVRDVEEALPTGFGYDRFATLGESMDQDRYLIIARRFQAATANPRLSTQGLSVIPLFWPGFRPADFARLNQDPSVSKLYSNGELDIWRVNARPRSD
jgi:hypothetical protein